MAALTYIISEVRRMRQENPETEASLRNITASCLRNKQTQIGKKKEILQCYLGLTYC